MVDELFDRGYQSGRADLNAGLDRSFARFARQAKTAFHVLNRVQWSAPWREQAPVSKGSGCA